MIRWFDHIGLHPPLYFDGGVDHTGLLPYTMIQKSKNKDKIACLFEDGFNNVAFLKLEGKSPSFEPPLLVLLMLEIFQCMHNQEVGGFEIGWTTNLTMINTSGAITLFESF